MNFDLPTLDQLTGGIFGAITSSQRTARVKTWLDTQPDAELMQAVYKELSARDKGAARPLRDKMDEVKRAKLQDSLAAEWASKAEQLLAQSKMNMADGMAWLRDAAKAGAPLSKESLASLKLRLSERVAKIEELQHAVAVQREAGAMFAQRLDTLSTKPLAEVLGHMEALARDFADWGAKSEHLMTLPEWHDIDPKLPPQLQTSMAQLGAIWSAFAAVVDIAKAALTDGDAPLPSIPVWADEIRAQRGMAEPAAKPATASKPKIDPEQREAAHAAVRPILTKLEEELALGHGKASAGAASNLRQILKEKGAWIDSKLDLQCHAALAAAGELEGWQRWRADQLRQGLLEQAQALLAKPLGGRKQQEAIRTLREQWKAADQGGIPNHGLWKRFDEACNEAYKVVEAWLEKVKAQSAATIAQRNALIDELKAWGEAQAVAVAAGQPDWKGMNRSLHQFSDRWREAGHLSERDFEALQTTWKTAFKAAAAPLEAAQKDTIAKRHALIEQAKALGANPDMRVDAVKALQQTWQSIAQGVPLDRKQEQKLWEAFKAPIDAAFARKDEARQAARAAHLASMSAHDKAVLDASQDLDAANASGDAGKIQAAVVALQAALRGQAVAKAHTPDSTSAETPANPLTHSEAAPSDTASSDVSATASVPSTASDAVAVSQDTAEIPKPAPVAKPAKPLVAMRGDDRTTGKAPVPSKFDKKSGDRPSFDRGDRGGDRFEPRAPRLSDAAFHAQRQALERAEVALRKLQSQAHGEALSGVLHAWKDRQAEQLPAAQALGKSVPAAVRTQWLQALGKDAANADAASTALLRLEMATGAPTPAEFLDARRALQLQLLTRRNDPTPAQTWGADVAKVLESAYSDASAKRLQAVLKLQLKS